MLGGSLGRTLHKLALSGSTEAQTLLSLLGVSLWDSSPFLANCHLFTGRELPYSGRPGEKKMQGSFFEEEGEAARPGRGPPTK